MRRTHLLLCSWTAALTVVSGMATAAQATSTPRASAPDTHVCQSSSGHPLGVGPASANDATRGSVTFSAVGAAAFDADHCTVSVIDVAGSYSEGALPPDSVDVIFSTDKHGSPGQIVSEQDGLAYVDRSGTGDLRIHIQPVGVNGRMFVSVVANMSLESGGEWDWQLTSGRPYLDEWANPDNGLGTGCTAFGKLGPCFGTKGNFIVTLRG